METLSTISDYRSWRREVPPDKVVGFVPTMGALHEGHLAHLRFLRERLDVIVASVFVNPTQFDRDDDFTHYPRDVKADGALLREEGWDVLFAPERSRIYPPDFATTVSVEGLTERYEGAHRPGHFDGVTTVVCKLLDIVQPDLLTLGEKDAQQLAVVRRMVVDLNFDVEICSVPTVRDSDGLALSSRNVRLSESERIEALSLFKCLQAAREALEDRPDVDRARDEMHSCVSDAVELDYADIVDDRDFTRATSVNGPLRAIIAGRIGGIRLIDNLLLKNRN